MGVICLAVGSALHVVTWFKAVFGSGSIGDSQTAINIGNTFFMAGSALLGIGVLGGLAKK
jgi:hypothetical protein